MKKIKSTPHARGSTLEIQLVCQFLDVYPACAGIHPKDVRVGKMCVCLPRMRGDPPSQRPILGVRARSTPHARGSTLTISPAPKATTVHPACTGNHPVITTSSEHTKRLPRMRGDPPLLFSFFTVGFVSTPHARGSTSWIKKAHKDQFVYPACAGIHPVPSPHPRFPHGLPRMRGDPPNTKGFFSLTA